MAKTRATNSLYVRSADVIMVESAEQARMFVITAVSQGIELQSVEQARAVVISVVS